MKAENYIEMLKRTYGEKKVYCLDTQKVVEWETLVEDYLMYWKEETDILSYINYLVYDRNSNCKLINE